MVRGLGGLFLLALVGLAPPAAAASRVALVMGNGAYLHADPLPNPPKDAAAVARVLENMGFRIFSGIDLDVEASRQLISRYVEALDEADTGLVFYAGHGIQVDGENYILPVDVTLETKADLRYKTVSLSDLVDDTADPDRTNIFIVDACRNNPLSRSFQRKSRSAVGQGLARLSAGSGTMIAFATAPDDVALDGDGDNSPFTKALLQHLETPGLEINQLMTRVRADVYAATDGQQLPWTNSALLGEVFLLPGGAPPSAPTVAAPPAVETRPAAIAPPAESSPAAVDAALAPAPVEPVKAQPAVAEPAVVDRRPKPRAFDMVICQAESGASWAGERILMYSQCEQIGGSWHALN